MSSSAVTTTNDDAANSKRYAVHKGYWDDKFISFFVKNIPQRKAPEINRGYYMRSKCMRYLIEKFLTITKRNCQIVNIGCGYDTLYWNLYEGGNIPIFGFFEVDLNEVVENKSLFIKSKPPLRKFLDGNVKIDKGCIDSDFYHLFSADICNITELNEKLLSAGIKKDIPTLFLAECVLVYISLPLVRNLLEYIANEFTTVMLVDYDPVNLSDKFGEVMKQHLQGRQCSLLGAQHDLVSKKDFYSMFQSVNAKLLFDLYNELASGEKCRIERIEFLDEIDLLFDLLKHYAITWSYTDGQNIGLKSISL